MATAAAIPRELAIGPSSAKSRYDHLETIEDHTIPVIDFSLLNSSNPEERSKAVTDLGKACEQWGFFLLINHGIPDSLKNRMLECVEHIFDLPEEEVKNYQGKHVMDPVRCGIRSFSNSAGQITRTGYIKLFVHPEFNFPDELAGYRDTTFEYCKTIREIITELLKGLSESLGLEPNYISKATDLESGFQRFVSQCYPACLNSDLVSGAPPHSDHSLLTIVTDNGITGLQTLHNGKWVKLSPPPNAVMVNTCDQLEIVTNGKYRSNVHRVVQNSSRKRISLVSTVGPSLDKVIIPAPELLDESHPAGYIGLTMREYYETHQSNTLTGKNILDYVRIENKQTP